eukprot:9589557-Alexandrium_andersonii.AAC.1
MPEVEVAWRQAVVKFYEQRKGLTWVRGPVAASVATLAKMGWQATTPTKWGTPWGQLDILKSSPHL